MIPLNIEEGKEGMSEKILNCTKKMLTPHFVNNRMTKSLPSILNAWRITVDNPNITEVIIYHKELDEPQQVHLNGGEAFVEIYTDNPVIIFVDKDRNKYVNIEYTCRKILRNVKISEVDNGSIYLKLAKIEKNIKKVYVGSMDPNKLVAGKGVKILEENGIEVECGVLKDECDKLNEVFFHYITNKTPYVVMKYAMTMDGKIACEMVIQNGLQVKRQEKPFKYAKKVYGNNGWN